MWTDAGESVAFISTRRDALVFSMREVMGLSTEEICKKIGISTTNLHVILFRARLTLRTCMRKNWFGVSHE